jgi:hypothetical protein
MVTVIHLSHRAIKPSVIGPETLLDPQAPEEASNPASSIRVLDP